jgi:hypothetical protein
VRRATEALLVAVLGLAGCAGTASLAPPLGPDARAAAIRIFERSLPSRCIMVHKVSVRVAGRDLVLTGHLVLDRQRGLRAVAVDEYGGPVMGFAACGARSLVDLAPPQISPELLERGPLQDLRTLFLIPQGPPMVIAGPASHAELRWAREGSWLEATVDLEAGRLLALAEGSGRRPDRELVITEVRSHGRFTSIPALIEVRNRRLHYKARFELLDLQPVDDRDEMKALEVCSE